MKQQRKRLEELRPAAPIRCMMCEKEKPAQDSRMFHGNPVCAECVVKLNSKIPIENPPRSAHQ